MKKILPATFWVTFVALGLYVASYLLVRGFYSEFHKAGSITMLVRGVETQSDVRVIRFGGPNAQYGEADSAFLAALYRPLVRIDSSFSSGEVVTSKDFGIMVW